MKKMPKVGIQIKKDRALYKFAWFRDINGKLLEDKVVAVQLLILLIGLVVTVINRRRR